MKKYLTVKRILCLFAVAAMILFSTAFKCVNSAEKFIVSGSFQADNVQTQSFQSNGSDLLEKVNATKRLATITDDIVSVVKGDVNNDVIVDLKDVTALSRYIAGWNGITVNEPVLDVDGDNFIDLKDITFLSRHLAGWPDYAVLPEPGIPGTPNPAGEVHVLMWRRYNPSEQTEISNFTKRTGINVRTTVTTENEYATKLVSLISGQDSPDVAGFSLNYFPGLVTKIMTPLNIDTFHLDDVIWDKSTMDLFKVNGKYFGVATQGSWQCESTNYCTYYNPKVLQDCGITTMPYDLYKQGNWNWETQREIVQAVHAKNTAYTGISLQSSDLYMYSAGVDFVKYDGSKFTNTLGNVKSSDLLVKSWTQVSSLNSDNLMSGWNLQNFVSGKIGLFSAVSYGLSNESGWFDGVMTQGGASGLQAVPLAGPTGGTAYTPTMKKVWGVPKGAKNTTRAYLFLRYYLDPANVSMDSTFYNSNFKEVFEGITNSNAKKSPMYSMGVTDYMIAGSYNTLIGDLVNTSPANMTTVLISKKTTVDAGLNRANTDLAKINYNLRPKD